MGYGIKISFPRPPQWRHRSPSTLQTTLKAPSARTNLGKKKKNKQKKQQQKQQIKNTKIRGFKNNRIRVDEA